MGAYLTFSVFYLPIHYMYFYLPYLSAIYMLHDNLNWFLNVILFLSTKIFQQLKIALTKWSRPSILCSKVNFHSLTIIAHLVKRTIFAGLCNLSMRVFPLLFCSDKEALFPTNFSQKAKKASAFSYVAVFFLFCANHLFFSFFWPCFIQFCENLLFFLTFFTFSPLFMKKNMI